MVGLMGELGADGADVTLVIGSSSPEARESHIWIEYRSRPEGPWIEIDPTPLPESPSERMLRLMGARIDKAFRPRAQTNRQHFSHRQVIVLEFLPSREP